MASKELVGGVGALWSIPSVDCAPNEAKQDSIIDGDRYAQTEPARFGN